MTGLERKKTLAQARSILEIGYMWECQPKMLY